MELINLIYSKPNPIFLAANDLICQFRNKIDNPEKEISLVIPEGVWAPIIKGDKKSPLMQFQLNGRLVCIRFPKGSTPYSDKLTQKVKNCIVYGGSIFDENNPETEYKPGEYFKMCPWQDVRPYTKDEEVFAVINLE